MSHKQSLKWIWMGCIGCIWFGVGCQSIPWKPYRTISPHSKQQIADPYGTILHASGGAQFRITRFIATQTLACAMLRADSKNAYAEIYINPHKARLVSGKLGIRALKSTMAAREPMYRRMVQHLYNIKDPSTVVRWSKYYFPKGTIKGGKSNRGMLCFQLARSAKDPERLQLGSQFRMQLTGVMVARGPVRLGWFYLGPMAKKK
jgi:hypothetical protein